MCEGKRETFGNRFSLSTTLVSRIKVKSLGLAARAVTYLTRVSLDPESVAWVLTIDQGSQAYGRASL